MGTTWSHGLMGSGMGVGWLIGVVLIIWPLWRICQKAGYPGALSLLVLVPLANLGLLYFLALAEWPVLKEHARKQTAPSAPTPGTSRPLSRPPGQDDDEPPPPPVVQRTR